jgi:hypothetical protein
MIYLTAPSTARTAWHRMWTEAVMAWSQVLSLHFTGGTDEKSRWLVFWPRLKSGTSRIQMKQERYPLDRDVGLGSRWVSVLMNEVLATETLHMKSGKFHCKCVWNIFRARRHYRVTRSYFQHLTGSKIAIPDVSTNIKAVPPARLPTSRWDVPSNTC